MPRTAKRKRTVKKKVTRKKPKRKATKAQLVTKLVKETQQLQKAGYSKEEILLIVASSIGGIALLTGIGLGGAALARRRKYEHEQRNPWQTELKRRERETAKRQARKESAEKRRDAEIERGAKWFKVFNPNTRSGLRKQREAEANFLSQKKANEAAMSGPLVGDYSPGEFQLYSYGKKRKRKRKRKVKKRKRKRKVKKRRKKRKFGRKVSKKPSAALRRMCKRLKVRLTVKRGKKRVYKSEKVLKKQCKTAMKRKK